ncbi:MAG: S8 family serine peptidase [Janthinobacterium lividum]
MSLSFSASASCKLVKCSADVDQATTATVPVIVQYANDPSDAEIGAVGNLGSVTNRMHSVKALAAKISASQLTALASRPGVAYVSLDRPVKARQAVTPPAAPTPPVVSTLTPIGTTPEFTAEPINAPWAVAQGFNGQNIGVAVIDSGINITNDLGVKTQGNSSQNRVVYSANFVPGETTTGDAYGHGTHVAGLIAGNGANSTGKGFSRTFLGIAPAANLINLRVLDENGEGSDSAVIAAIETAISLKNVYNIKVINLSLGRPIYESYTLDPLCQAVEQAWKAGIVVVAAAGNDGRDLALNSEGYGTVEAPGNDPYVITVGATNAMNTASVNDDVMATYSSKGPSFIDQISKPDIVAPGNLVTSLLSAGSNLQAENPAFYTPTSWYMTPGTAAASTVYYPLSGTSMATAVTSGAVADLEEVAGYLTPDQIKVLLMASANKTVIPQTNTITDPASGISYIAHNDVFTQGAGYLDLQAAINKTWTYAFLLPSVGYAMSPVATYNATTGNVTLVTDSTALWGRGLPLATSTLVGASAVYGQSAYVSTGATALWGSTALWGRSDPQAFTALWGRSAVDGSTALWGRGTPDAATALWGRSSTDASNTDNGSTALWGRWIPLTQ